MLKEEIIKNLGKNIIEKTKDILSEECEEYAKKILSENRDEDFLEKYKRSLDESLLKQYGNEDFYEDLCKVLLMNNNISFLLKRCYNRDIFDDASDEIFIDRIMQEFQGKPYNRSMVRTVLQHIGECAFKSFNELEDYELNKLKNIIKREGDKICTTINKGTAAIIEGHKKILNNINQDNNQKSCDAYGNDISWGCKNPVRHFLGRENDINCIKKILDQDEKIALWIYGMGGMGKTQLCRKLYYELKMQYEYIGWISYQGSLKYSLVNSIKNLEKTGDLEQDYKNAISFINCLGKRLILFIDNYDNVNDFIADIEAMQCDVVVTSRSKNPDTFIGYDLSFLDFKDCKNLFKIFYTLEDNIIMNEIIHKTGYLALAVELVAKTGQKLGLSLQDYYFKLEEKGFDIRTVVKSNWEKNGEKLNTALSKHFGIVFDLTEFSSNLEAMYILKNFSVLPYLSVAQYDITEWLSLDKEENMLFELADSGWLQRTSDLEYMMHPIISFTVKNEVTPTIKDCVNLVTALSEYILLEPGSNYLHVFRYLPYADSVGSYFVGKKNKRYELVILYTRLAEIYRQNGEYNRAYGWGKEASYALNYINNKKQKGFAGNLIYNIMSEICLDKRDCDDECRKWALCAVDSDKKYEEEIDDVKKSTSFHNLACAYIQLRDNEKALEYEKIAERLREANLNKNDVRLLNVYRNLAMINRRMKYVNEAYNYQKIVIDTLEEIHIKEPEHPDFPVAYNLYSFILRDMGKMDEAIAYQEKAIKIREKINKNDPKLAINYNNLAMLKLGSNKLKEAEMWQRKALETDLKNRQKYHHDVAEDFFNYAKIFKALGEFSQAIKCLRICRKIELNNNSDKIEEIDKMIFSIKEKRDK